MIIQGRLLNKGLLEALGSLRAAPNQGLEPGYPGHKPPNLSHSRQAKSPDSSEKKETTATSRLPRPKGPEAAHVRNPSSKNHTGWIIVGYGTINPLKDLLSIDHIGILVRFGIWPQMVFGARVLKWAAYGSFQKSGAFIQTPNSRALIGRTPAKRTPRFIETATDIISSYKN